MDRLWTSQNSVDMLTTSVSKLQLSTRGEVLASSRPPTDPSEPSLLSDLPYTLQGHTSSTLPFLDTRTIGLPPSLPLPVLAVLNALVEPALLYKTLTVYIESPSGLVGQAFRRVIEDELQGYLRLVSKIEEEIRKEIAAETVEGWTFGGVTLKKCVYWLRESTMVLRLMTDMTDRSKDKSGGQLLSILYSYNSHGDPFVSGFADRILARVSRPIYELLCQYIYSGDFRDPYDEFFIRKGPTESTQGAQWDGKFKLIPDQVPTFISAEIVEKVYQTGKSLDFIKTSCGDSSWVDTFRTTHAKTFSYDDAINTVELSIDIAYQAAVGHLMELLTNRFKLRQHIQALKNFLLLGQGDFIALLMELLAPSLESPANMLYRHNLTSTLETAIRGSNAQFSPPEVLQSLDARMLELSHGEIGWDVFTLEYKVDAPLDVILNSSSTRQYLKIFNFLWRLKRVGFSLNSSWRRSITGARGILSSRNFQQIWKPARGTCSEMIHCTGQLEYYILYEVIESSWIELQTQLTDRNDITLDQLIAVHSKYLSNITHKGLLSSSLIHLLHDLLKIMLSFSDSIDALYNFSMDYYDAETEIDTDSLQTISERIHHLRSSFRATLQKLISQLSRQNDSEMRFLGIRLNFNEFYLVKS
ncbi:Spc98 family-domain-containing protein [Lipomyces oligophaga]|uniref:Spc98 family-domain-containing protein n=1 Tax=Lipomyces oligophaga TaxID=45792 RepID=UPI0034CE296D